jgi:hypothetical protein
MFVFFNAYRLLFACILQVFLDLPLSGAATGKISYRQDHALWHEVTVFGDPHTTQPPKKFIFNLQQTQGDNRRQAVDFSLQLNKIFCDLTSKGAREAETLLGGEENVLPVTTLTGQQKEGDAVNDQDADFELFALERGESALT